MTTLFSALALSGFMSLIIIGFAGVIYSAGKVCLEEEWLENETPHPGEDVGSEEDQRGIHDVQR